VRFFLLSIPDTDVTLVTSRGTLATPLLPMVLRQFVYYRVT
jgi:hypothetical protein